MKKLISVLLCLCMLISLTGCAGVSQEDFEEIKDAVVSELESYVKEAAGQLAQQLKARFQETLNQGTCSGGWFTR